MSAKVFLHTLLCALIFATAFYRLSRMNGHTDTHIGWATTALALAALLLGVSPHVGSLWPWWGRITIHWTELLMLAAIAGRQCVRLGEWAGQQPPRYVRPARACPINFQATEPQRTDR